MGPGSDLQLLESSRQCKDVANKIISLPLLVLDSYGAQLQLKNLRGGVCSGISWRSTFFWSDFICFQAQTLF